MGQKKKEEKNPISAGDGKREHAEEPLACGHPPGSGAGGALLQTFRVGLGDMPLSPRAPCDARGHAPAFLQQQPGFSHPPGWGGRAPASRRSAGGLYLEEKEERW